MTSLRGKSAVVTGGSSGVGKATVKALISEGVRVTAVARAFAREGAKVFLAGRTLSRLNVVAKDISAEGGVADIAEVDALDEQAVNQYADEVAAKAGRIDIAINAVGILHVQGPPFEDYMHLITAYTRTNFLTAKAVARHMAKQGAGVILTLSTPGARLTGQGFLGNGVSSAAIEAFSRILAGELGASGIRVICLRPHAIPEAVATSHTRELFSGHATRAGSTVEDWLAGLARTATLLKRLPTLAEVANFVAFVASDRAGAMTGAIVNLTCGSLVD